MTLLTTLLGMTALGLADEPRLSYLALGDSYTIGEAVAEADRWPVVLAVALRKRGIPVADPRIIARTGWTTDELSAAMDRADLEPCHDLVSLLIGVNNQYRGREVDDFRVEYALLLDRAIALAGGRRDRVFVLSIPDWGYTPFGSRSGRDLARVSAEIDAYNAAKREITQARGVAYFDITPSTREARDNASLVADDGLHPSGALYQRWAAQIVDEVESLVRQAESGCAP